LLALLTPFLNLPGPSGRLSGLSLDFPDLEHIQKISDDVLSASRIQEESQTPDEKSTCQNRNKNRSHHFIPFSLALK
jgi:hypothetical protein